MDNRSDQDDLLRLNALVDGELDAAGRAEMAARLANDRELAQAYAVLARLKATVAEEDADPPVLALPVKPRRHVGLALCACLGVLMAAGLYVAIEFTSHRQPAAVAEGPTAITLASLPAGTALPRLDTAGLKLVGLAIEPGQVPVFTAQYRGPHGCRLDLRAWRTGAEAPPLAGTSRYRWTAGDLVYELVAHGMPPWRFAIIAGGAEAQTRRDLDVDRIDRKLRRADIGAPPCAG